MQSIYVLECVSQKAMGMDFQSVSPCWEYSISDMVSVEDVGEEESFEAEESSLSRNSASIILFECNFVDIGWCGL